MCPCRGEEGGLFCAQEAREREREDVPVREGEKKTEFSETFDDERRRLSDHGIAQTYFAVQ